MADERTPPLSYERPPPHPVPRWQFRLLFLLVVINLAITIQMAYAPSVGPALKKWWADRQTTRRLQAAQRQAWGFTEPASKVVWDDDPETARSLLAAPGGGYKPVMVPQSVRYGNVPSLAGWPAGAAAREPAVVGPLSFRNFPVSEQRNIPPAEVYGVAMVHGFKVPSGQERLVYVLVEGKIDLEGLTQYALGRGSESAAQPVEGQLGKSLRLVAVPCRPAQGTKPPLQLTDDATSLVLVSGGNSPWRVGWKWAPRPDGKGGEVRLDAKDQFRFYAGQPDPNDPSHFTIDYDLDGKRGRIHGRLKDDGKVEWQPEAGTVTGKYWDFD